jgi:LAS superfamily LD-carboxypeptidase LdcB
MALLLDKMAILTPEQLTGRVRTHVLDIAEPRCTLHPDAADAFLRLRAAAKSAGIDLAPTSTFRDFQHQLAIWNDKFHGRRPLLDANSRAVNRADLSDEQAVHSILTWSALPGASRHHWGTEIDVIDQAALLPGQQAQLIAPEYARGGVFERLASWLPEHCGAFGFFLPYDIDRGGVRPEPWHLSYAPVSSEALLDLTVEVLGGALKGVELAGADVVKQHLHELHARYVVAVAAASAAALAYSRPSPVARLS